MPNYLPTSDGQYIYGGLHEHIGFSPEVAQIMFPLNMLFNMDYVERNGDIIYFEELVNIPVGDPEDRPAGGCDGRTMQCVGSQRIQLELKKRWNDLFVFHQCRISKLSKMATRTVEDTISKFVGRQQKAYTLKEAEYGIKKIKAEIMKDATIDGNITADDFITGLNMALEKVQEQNPLVPLSEYTLLITQKASFQMKNLKNQCCDFLANRVPADVMPPTEAGATIIVPNEWLSGSDYMLYIKAYAPYGVDCPIESIDPLTNTHIGYLGYTVDRIWDVDYLNFQPDVTKAIGVVGNISITTPAVTAPAGK